MIRTVAGIQLETRPMRPGDRGFIAPRLHRPRAETDALLDGSLVVVWCSVTVQNALYAFVLMANRATVASYVLPALRGARLVEDAVAEMQTEERAA